MDTMETATYSPTHAITLGNSQDLNAKSKVFLNSIKEQPFLPADTTGQKSDSSKGISKSIPNHMRLGSQEARPSMVRRNGCKWAGITNINQIFGTKYGWSLYKVTTRLNEIGAE
jgi:hypothetical protein